MPCKEGIRMNPHGPATDEELDRWIAAAEREPRDHDLRAMVFRAALFAGVLVLCIVGALIARSCS